MTQRAALLASRVVPTDASLTRAENDTILEIAYLAIAADRTLADAELEAFRHVMGHLATRTPQGAYRGSDRAHPASDRELRDKLDALAAKTERVEVDAHLRSLCAGLSPEARRIAYKVAYAIALADLDTADEEFEFDLTLIDALELSNAEAEELVAEVTAEMFAGSD